MKTLRPSMEKLSIAICVDVEPNERAIDPNVAKDWVGFEKTFEFFEELRPRLEYATQAPVHFSWFLRMDPQIAHAYGSPAWAITRYRRLFDRLETNGDEIGLHTHAWRWDEASSQWIADMGDQAWVEHCVRTSFEAFEQSLNRPCRSFRFGDHWMNDATLDLVERLGVQFDLTAIPGRTELSMPEQYTGLPPDYSRIPRRPFRPSKISFTQTDEGSLRDLWSVPLSTIDPDEVFAFLSAGQNGKRGANVGLPSATLRNCYEGSFDRADNEGICGWVFDAKMPNQILEVDIYDGEVLMATVPADGFRSDLLAAGKGNGRHAFALPTPRLLRDGRRRSIRTKVSNGGFELGNSPRMINCDSSAGNDSDAIFLHTSADPWLMSRSIDTLLAIQRKSYLALTLTTGEILNPVRLFNLTDNFMSISSHPLVRQFIFETPTELVKRLA